MEKNRKNQNSGIAETIKLAARINCMISFFVPIRKGSHILDAAFLYGMGNFSKIRTRPFASVVIEPESGTLLEYCNAYFRDFVDTEVYPMDAKLDYSVPYAKSAREQGELVERIQELYGSIRELPWKESLSAEEVRTVREYRECFDRAVPGDLLPFYEALAPEFFQWLEEGENE